MNQNNCLESSRRGFLKLGLFSALSCLWPFGVFAAAPNGTIKRKVLSFYNIHTEEFLQIGYWVNGQYQSDALEKINYILRDHRTGKAKPIDKSLLDLLHLIHIKIEGESPFHVISGYRSPETNAVLRKRSQGVARHSYHMRGEAVDIYVPGCSLSQLRLVAMKLKRGGVGYYTRDSFIHVDVGPLRYW